MACFEVLLCRAAALSLSQTHALVRHCCEFFSWHALCCKVRSGRFTSGFITPHSGAALADLIPESAKSGAARADVNERTSNLPTFGDVGRSLTKNFGTNDPKDVGRAIDENTPSESISTALLRRCIKSATTRTRTLQSVPVCSSVQCNDMIWHVDFDGDMCTIRSVRIWF